MHVVLLAGSALAIYVACAWFLNAVEWLGLHLRVGPLAVGTVLAAVGTALPESVVTLVAVVSGDGERKHIGVGAALGGPLVLSTIAYAVVGVILLARGRRQLVATIPAAALEPAAVAPGGDGDEHGRAEPARPVDVPVPTAQLLRDQTWFLAVFVVKIGLGLVAFAIKPWLGLLFFAVYAVYFAREMSQSGEHDAADLAPLKLTPRAASPRLAPVLGQTLGALAVIFVASQLFVAQLEWAGPRLGLSATVVALLLSPVATELPEVMNAVIWVRQGKTQLALANISGAMMIQATVPSGLGLLFTPWRFTAPLVLSGLVTMLAIGYLVIALRAGRLSAPRLAASALFYLGFAVALAAVT